MYCIITVSASHPHRLAELLVLRISLSILSPPFYFCADIVVFLRFIPLTREMKISQLSSYISDMYVFFASSCLSSTFYSSLGSKPNSLGCHSRTICYTHTDTRHTWTHSIKAHCPRKVHCSTCWLMDSVSGMKGWGGGGWPAEEESCPWPCSAASRESLMEKAKCVRSPCYNNLWKGQRW